MSLIAIIITCPFKVMFVVLVGWKALAAYSSALYLSFVLLLIARAYWESDHASAFTTYSKAMARVITQKAYNRL
ncbi:hypothetical protein HCH_03090 [Hahella chejuensis KCTC 2396]|uniref:Uncharacterized protein n=1 Tax=Hahella chejuensis (strain KCTC 2396) TaxID=349521 RepID=Q2SHL8_HAHCH|nr:hypothetical protein HCH_03090 [Hahella chejuensis KCTC 2396]